MNLDGVEILGYFASGLVALSMTIANIKILRIVNMTGAVFFVSYGFAIKAYPVVVLNSLIVLVHCFHLYKLSRK